MSYLEDGHVLVSVKISTLALVGGSLVDDHLVLWPSVGYCLVVELEQ